MSLLSNKKASFDYDIAQTLEVGIELLGTEVKSLRKGLGSIVGARVAPRGGEVYLVGATIPPFQEKNAAADFDPERNRRLLLTKKEIKILEDTDREKGLTIVPISVYNKGRKIKLEIGIAKGKKKFDKRETIKKRETDRDIRRTMKYE